MNATAIAVAIHILIELALIVRVILRRIENPLRASPGSWWSSLCQALAS